MFAFELKKFFRQKTGPVMIILYLFLSLFWLFNMITGVTDENMNFIYGNFFDYMMSYKILMLFFVICICCQIIPLEYSTNMMPLLSVTQNGRRSLANVKMKLALLLANCFYLVWLGVVMLSYVINFGFTFDKLISGEEYFRAVMENPAINTFGELLSIRLLGAFLSVNVTALICLEISGRLKKALLSSVLFLVAAYAMGILPGIHGVRILSSLSPFAFCELDTGYDLRISFGDLFISFYQIGMLFYLIVISVFILWFWKKEESFFSLMK